MDPPDDGKLKPDRYEKPKRSNESTDNINRPSRGVRGSLELRAPVRGQIPQEGIQVNIEDLLSQSSTSSGNQAEHADGSHLEPTIHARRSISSSAILPQRTEGDEIPPTEFSKNYSYNAASRPKGHGRFHSTSTTMVQMPQNPQPPQSQITPRSISESTFFSDSKQNQDDFEGRHDFTPPVGLKWSDSPAKPNPSAKDTKKDVAKEPKSGYKVSVTATQPDGQVVRVQRSPMKKLFGDRGFLGRSPPRKLQFNEGPATPPPRAAGFASSLRDKAANFAEAVTNKIQGSVGSSGPRRLRSRLDLDNLSPLIPRPPPPSFPSREVLLRHAADQRPVAGGHTSRMAHTMPSNTTDRMRIQPGPRRQVVIAEGTPNPRSQLVARYDADEIRAKMSQPLPPLPSHPATAPQVNVASQDSRPPEPPKPKEPSDYIDNVISLGPRAQGHLLVDLEILMQDQINKFIQHEYGRGRITEQSRQAVANQWYGEHHSAVVGFCYDLTTQRDLILRNVSGILFPVVSNNNVRAVVFDVFGAAAEAFNHRSFCMTDRALQKLFDQCGRVLGVLDIDYDARTAFDNLQHSLHKRIADKVR